jgi:hypothetical protein
MIGFFYTFVVLVIGVIGKRKKIFK